MRPAWRWTLGAGAAFVAALALGALALPLWLHPLLESRISSAIGRPVAIGHVSIAWTRPPRLTAETIRVASPADFPSEVPNWATIARVVAQLDLRPVLHLAPPDIIAADVTALQVTSVQLPDGRNNFTFILPPPGAGAAPRIGAIRLHDSHAQVTLQAAQAELSVDLRTEGPDGNTIIGDVTGTYAGEAVHGRVTGGPIPALQDAIAPYAVDIRLASGTFQLALAGTVRDLFRLGGADLQLEVSGSDLAAIHQLTGLPFPPTPPYRLTSPLAYENGVIRLPALSGRLGSSDIAGALDIDIRPARPTLTGALSSNRVDLQDLAGFIGSQPGRPETPGLTPSQRQAVARAIAHPRLIPTLPMDLPAIRSADVHLTYQAAGVIGRDMPFDSLAARHFGIKPGTPIPADFPPLVATSVLNRVLLLPLM